MDKELVEVYEAKQKNLNEYLSKHNIEVLYVLEVSENNSIGGIIQYYFLYKEDLEEAVKQFSNRKYEKYEITNFDNIFYDKGVPTFLGSNGVEFGSISGLDKFKQELKYIKIPNKSLMEE